MQTVRGGARHAGFEPWAVSALGSSCSVLLGPGRCAKGSTPLLARRAVHNEHVRPLRPRAEDEDGGRGGTAGRPQLAKELAFFERAKQRLRNKDAYNDFLKCLTMYTQEIISRQELLVLANDIIGRLPDLMVRSALQGAVTAGAAAARRNGVGLGVPYRFWCAPLHGGSPLRGGWIPTAGAAALELARLSMR